MNQRTLKNTFTANFVEDLENYNGLRLLLFDIPVSDVTLTLANKYYKPSKEFADHQYEYMYFYCKHIEGTDHSAIPINLEKLEEFLVLSVMLPNRVLDEATFIEYVFMFGDPKWIEQVLKTY